MVWYWVRASESLETQQHRRTQTVVEYPQTVVEYPRGVPPWSTSANHYTTALTRLKVGGSMPSPRNRVFSFNIQETLPHIVSLSTQAYKWVPATYCRG